MLLVVVLAPRLEGSLIDLKLGDLNNFVRTECASHFFSPYFLPLDIDVFGWVDYMYSYIYE